MALLALLFAVAARAGVPVVHAGPPEAGAAAVAQVAARTGVPAAELSAVALDALLKGPPAVAGAGALRHCAGAPTRAADLRAQVVRAEASLREGDAAGALDRLDLAIAELGCLADRAEAPVAGRLFLLRGALLAQRGDTEGARAELRTALGFVPAPTWDAAWPVEGAVVLQEALDDHARGVLTAAPAAAPARPWLDGRPLEVAVGPQRLGLHLVQVATTGGLHTAWLTLGGDATLVVPASFRPPVLEALGQPAAADEVARLLQAATGAPVAYAVAGGGIWLVSVEGGFPEITALVAPPPAADGGKKRR